MPEEEKTNLRLEIAHVLFMDIVGYSKLLIDEQSESLHELNQIVRGTDAAREAEAAGKLIRLPTGDGMALVFTNSIEAPVECALQISQALRAQPSLPLRMGIHSGPVHHLDDINERTNIAGAGINIAQRVMDCGDAGHILISRRVADDLAPYRHWQPYLHDLGDCEVKHGLTVSLVNLYADVVGNPIAPVKFGGPKAGRKKIGPGAVGNGANRWLLGAAALLIAGLAILVLWLGMAGSRRAAPAAAAPLPVSTPFAPGMPGAQATAGLPVPDKSIAVLPFENLSADKDNAFFADGVQDEILTDLAKVADLKVISRTSVMPYKVTGNRNLREIGRQLGVANVVEGSVQRAGNEVRVNAQLIDARTDVHLWAEHYDRPLDNVFAIQSEIAEAIAGHLQAQLSPREKSAMDTWPTADLAAYDLYMRAQNLFADNADQIHSRGQLPEATHLLEEALARDPKFLRAWCLLERVQCYIYFDGFDHTPERLEQVRLAVQKAAALDPDAGETHLALADYYYHGFRAYDHALTELDLARRTLPNNAEVYSYSGFIKRRQGHWAEAVRDLERSLELDPRDFPTFQQLALAYGMTHRYDDQAHILDRALNVVPGDPNTRVQRAQTELDGHADIKPFQQTLAALLLENPAVGADVDDPMLALCERTPAAAARAVANDPPEGVGGSGGVIIPHAYTVGLVARCTGDVPRARAAFTTARAEVAKVVAAQPNLAAAVSLLGLIDAGLGRKEDAIAEGRRGCELLPIGQDAVDGPLLAVNLAQIYAWTGEKAAAIDQIAAIEKVPNQLSYGLLKLNPVWDDLRGDPRFEALVVSLAPKPASR